MNSTSNKFQNTFFSPKEDALCIGHTHLRTNVLKLISHWVPEKKKMHHYTKKVNERETSLFLFFIWWRSYIDKFLIHSILSFRASIYIMIILLVLLGIYFKNISKWGRIKFDFLNWKQRNMHLIISFHFIASFTYILGSSLPRIKVVP